MASLHLGIRSLEMSAKSIALRCLVCAECDEQNTCLTIEPTFANVKAHNRTAKGPSSVETGLVEAFMLLAQAE